MGNVRGTLLDREGELSIWLEMKGIRDGDPVVKGLTCQDQEPCLVVFITRAFMRPGLGRQSATVCSFGLHPWAVQVGCPSRSLAFFLEKKSKERDLKVGLLFNFPLHVTPLFLTPSPIPGSTGFRAALVSGFLNAILTSLWWLFFTGSKGEFLSDLVKLTLISK